MSTPSPEDTTRQKSKSVLAPQYGFDAPGIMRAALAIGAVGLLIGLGLGLFLPGWLRLVGIGVLVASLGPFGIGVCIFLYGYFGKRWMRDYMIGRIDWTGDEQVLDIGTGRGLLLIGAAKKLDRGGHAFGTDIWRPEDLSDNSLDALTANVRSEGVEKTVTLLTEDARKLSFADASFDVVLSLYCIHNIEDESEQRNACFEIARVLKPGGRALIADFTPTHGYADAFRQAALTVSSSRSYFGVACAPMWMVEAIKPG